MRVPLCVLIFVSLCEAAVADSSVLERESGVPEPKCDGIVVEVADLNELRQAVDDLNTGTHKPGTVIRLSAERYGFPVDGPAIAIRDVQGSEECPIVIEGPEQGALLDGGRKPLVNYVARTLSFPEESKINCFVLRDSSWVVFRNLRVVDCWPTFLFMHASSYVTLRDSHVIGSTYAVFMQDRTHHVLVENNDWEQDPSGEVWSTIPWGITHHGSRKHLNGAFVGATSIAGGVIIRRNTMRNAYNAIRLKSVDCPQTNRCNTNVEIYNNSMEYIRDNPIEIERYAANWWVYGNRIHNSHAWFSMDGGRGGPHFVFSNVGWFNDIPARLCRDEAWTNEVQADGTPFKERECKRSRRGKALKLGNRMDLPTYIFHNSWYLRAPVGDGGAAGPIRFWNNAIEFCDPSANDDTCAPVVPFYKREDEDRFVWNVDPSDIADHRMSYVVSNMQGFPQEFRAHGYPVHGFFAERLGFTDPTVGDFRLELDSPVRNRGCLVYRAGPNKLICAPTSYRWRPDIGAYQGRQLYRGPVFTHFDGPKGPDSAYVERPRIIRLSLDALDQGLFTVHFSVPIQLPKGSLETTVILETTAPSRVSVPCIVAIEDHSVLACDTVESSVLTSTVTRVLLPNDIRRRGGAQAPLTLWGNPEPIIGLQL
jgi:hypothetical protein